MARINTRCEFAEYIFRKLGSPLVDVFMECFQNGGFGCGSSPDCGVVSTTGQCVTGPDADSVQTVSTGSSGSSGSPLNSAFYKVKTQCDYVIDEALDFFQEYGSNQGNVETVFLMQLEAGKVFYDAPDGLIAITQPYRQGLGGSGGMGFDSEEAQASVGLFSFSSTFGNRGIYSFLGGGSYDNLLTAEIAFEYMSLVDLRYIRKFTVTLNELEKKIMVLPQPLDTDDGKIIAVTAFIKVPDEVSFGHLWVQRYAVALAKMTVGVNTGLFSGITLPNGGTFNSEFFYTNGKEERDLLETELLSGKWGTVPASAIFLQG